MRKLLYILAATFIVASCNESRTNVEPVDSSAISIEGHYYNIYKVKIENHTYIMMTGYGTGLEHDPECPYCKEHGFPEHKL